MWQGLKQIFKSYFVTGLLVLVPLFVSVRIFTWVIRSTDEMLATAQWMPYYVPGLGLLLALAIILIAGFIGRNVVGRYLFNSTGEIINHIPFVGTIYSSTRQLMETVLGGSTKNKFGRVVLVEYPHPGAQTIAFVTSESVPQEVAHFFSEPHLSVYIPTTPNPISGFYLYVPVAKARQVSMSVEEAFKLVVSLGLVPPKHVITGPGVS
jgi:uncharacterized membrane protein